MSIETLNVTAEFFAGCGVSESYSVSHSFGLNVAVSDTIEKRPQMAFERVVELLQEEEQEGYENLPEGLQQGVRGQGMVQP